MKHTEPKNIDTIAHTLMIQGTTSDAGKSTLVAGLCRLLARNNNVVAPFKPQNMALNSAVTKDGGEIGRAQAVQAHAANIEPQVDFNPILIKPNSDTDAQIIVHGKALTSMQASQYHDYKKVAMQAVLASHHRLQQQFEYIVVEGAGSPAEINLREGDIANMGFAEAVNCPVILVADIDKGGVFAHIVGTMALLSQSEQDRIIGFVINRFRGDLSLLQSGLDWLEQRTNKPVLGVLPYIHGLSIAAEDAIDDQQIDNSDSFGQPSITVLVLVTPRMSNHTDFDVLRWHSQINVKFIYANQDQQNNSLPHADLIILAGSKNVQQDLDFLKKNNWHLDIKRHLRYGGKVMGICGGLQMLGERINDPNGVESSITSCEGLGLLPLTTTLTKQKKLQNIDATLQLFDSHITIKGYEIHTGFSVINNQQTFKPLLKIKGVDEGFISEDEQIIATYCHGIFDNEYALMVIMKWAGAEIKPQQNFIEQQNNAINILADAMHNHMDIEQILSLSKHWQMPEHSSK